MDVDGEGEVSHARDPHRRRRDLQGIVSLDVSVFIDGSEVRTDLTRPEIERPDDSTCARVCAQDDLDDDHTFFDGRIIVVLSLFRRQKQRGTTVICGRRDWRPTRSPP